MNGYGYYGGYDPYYISPPPAGGFRSPYWEGPWTGSRFYDYDMNLILDDDEIADLVRDNIDADPFIPRSDKNDINIEVRDGVVTLSGEVRNKRSKPLSYADAFWCDGVADVESQLSVKKRQNGEKRKNK